MLGHKNEKKKNKYAKTKVSIMTYCIYKGIMLSSISTTQYGYIFSHHTEHPV